MTKDKLTLSQLEQYLSKAAWILKGPVDASDFKVYIFPLLFFKRISDVYDEEYHNALKESEGDAEYASLPEFHRFILPEGCHWKNVRETTSNIGLAIEQALRGIEQANQEFLYGIFGDAQWSNKNKLSDRLLIDLIEHFSQYNLSNSNVEPDLLGQAYEYLIKHFADLTNKKAGEFYTPRSVVHLLGLILDPHEGETIYDPACGTGGMLLECVDHLKHENEDYRTLKLFGQEKNLTSSSIARMNMFMHGIEEFQIVRGDTLAQPAFLENDELKKFNVILANPPYSIKAWDRKSFENDPYGRNLWGTPPQGCADYAFQQHMHKSLNEQNGRSISLWPHGILFRDAEADMRRKMIENDLVECVIGLGPNLFYNSPMEACLLITKTNKEKSKKGKVLIINAVKEVKQDKNIGFLEQSHIDRIYQAYKAFQNEEGFCKLLDIEEILQNRASLNIAQYVSNVDTSIEQIGIDQALENWKLSSDSLKKSMDELFQILN